MNLRHYKNLVPDTPLHRQLEALLRENGGQLSTLAVCEQVLLMPRTDLEVARALVAALAEEDPRLRATDGIVEWIEPAAQEVWRAARRFAVIDVETTNGRPDEQRIIEIGLCRVEDGRIAREWDALINPGQPIPYWVRRLTGITNEAVKDAPPFEAIAPRLLEEVEDAVLVGHHARFDVDCLNNELSRLLGKRLANPYLCTAELARRFLPGSDNYRLQTLSEWLRLTHERPHRAGSDARATAELFCRLLETPEMAWGDYLRPRLTPARPIRARPPKIAETNPLAIS